MRALAIATMSLALVAGAGSAVASTYPNTREGFWVGFGFGGASTGTECSSCASSREVGPAGYIRAGATLRPNLLLGGETNGWLHSESGVDERLGFASAVALWYPSRNTPFYLKFGLGGMTYKADDGVDELTAMAPSVGLGLGYELRASRNVSVVPYMNSMTSTSVDLKLNGNPVQPAENISLNLLQLGVGVTWH